MRALIYNFLLLSNVSNDVKILFRVAKGTEMSEKNRFFFKIREKSEIFVSRQGNTKFYLKVCEKSGSFMLR